MITPKQSKLAIVAFILSIVSLLIPVLPIVTLIMGIVALSAINNNKEMDGRSLAIAAIIISAAAIVLHILLLVGLVSLVGSLFGNLATMTEKGPQESINNCKAQEAGWKKDMCIFTTVSFYMNQTESIDPNICNEIITVELSYYCSAIITKDKSYCEKITDAESKIKCFGMIDELKRGGETQKVDESV